MEPCKVIYGFDISPCSSPTGSSDDFSIIKHSMLSIELHHAKPSAKCKDQSEQDNPSAIKPKEEFVKYVFGSQPICIRGKRMY